MNTLKAQTERALLVMINDLAQSRNVDAQVLALAERYGIKLAD